MKLSEAEALLKWVKFFNISIAPKITINPDLKKKADEAIQSCKTRIEPDTKRKKEVLSFQIIGQSDEVTDGDRLLEPTEEQAILDYFNDAFIKDKAKLDSLPEFITLINACSQIMQSALECDYIKLQDNLKAHRIKLGLNNPDFRQFILTNCISKVALVSQNYYRADLKRSQWEKTLLLLLQFSTSTDLSIDGSAALQFVIDHYNSSQYKVADQLSRQKFDKALIDIFVANIKHRASWERTPEGSPPEQQFMYDSYIGRTLYSIANVLASDSTIESAYNTFRALFNHIERERRENLKTANQEFETKVNVDKEHSGNLEALSSGTQSAESVIRKQHWHSIMNAIFIPVFEAIRTAHLTGVKDTIEIMGKGAKIRKSVIELTLEEYYYYIINPRYKFFQNMQNKMHEYFSSNRVEDAYNLIAVVSSFHEMAEAASSPCKYTKIDNIYKTANKRISKIADLDQRNYLKRALFIFTVATVLTVLLLSIYGLVAFLALSILLTNTSIITGMATVVLLPVVGGTTRAIYKSADQRGQFASPYVQALSTFHQAAKAKATSNPSHAKPKEEDSLEAVGSKFLHHVGSYGTDN